MSLAGVHYEADADVNRQTYRIQIRERMTGNPEVMSSSVGLVPTNALVVIKGANCRVVGNSETIRCLARGYSDCIRRVGSTLYQNRRFGSM
jgi:hypothetical protein